MHFVATLISAPGTQALTDALVRAAAGDLPFGRGPHWLSPSEAADIFFWPEDSDLPENGEEEEQIIRDFSSLLRECVKGAPVDCIVQRNDEHRRKKLFIADMDSTMIGQECIDELAAYVGRKDHVAAITERAMRGEIAFEPALRERVALLKGLPASVADQVIAQNITLTPGGRTLVATMREWFADPVFRGCAFINAAAELGSSSPEVLRICQRHKRDMLDTIAALVPEGPTKANTACSAAVAVDGAIVHNQMADSASALGSLRQLLRALTQTQTPVRITHLLRASPRLKKRPSASGVKPH